MTGAQPVMAAAATGVLVGAALVATPAVPGAGVRLAVGVLEVLLDGLAGAIAHGPTFLRRAGTD